MEEQPKEISLEHKELLEELRLLSARSESNTGVIARLAEMKKTPEQMQQLTEILREVRTKLEEFEQEIKE